LTASCKDIFIAKFPLDFFLYSILNILTGEYITSYKIERIT
jgi:hypothetical protein